MNQVVLLSMAVYQFSIGDIATGKATAVALAERGVACTPVDHARFDRTTVIGGGHTLGPQPHSSRFRQEGRHVLNAVGVHRGGDRDYLTEYRYVSLRDDPSAEALGRTCEVVPCPAVLLRPAERESSRSGHVVVQCDPFIAAAVQQHHVDLLVVDPQPWRRVPWPGPARALEPAHSPEVLTAALCGAHAVISRSLHLSIFALCASVPFCCLDWGNDPQSNKLRAYWERAGLQDMLYDGDDPIRHAVTRKHDWQAVLTREQKRVSRHLDEMVATL